MVLILLLHYPGMCDIFIALCVIKWQIQPVSDHIKVIFRDSLGKRLVNDSRNFFPMLINYFAGRSSGLPVGLQLLMRFCN
jgi:hypothetical protein